MFNPYCTTNMLMLYAHQTPGFHIIHTCEDSVAVHRHTELEVAMKYGGGEFMIMNMFGQERKATNPKAISYGHIENNTDNHKMKRFSSNFNFNPLYAVF